MSAGEFGETQISATANSSQAPDKPNLPFTHPFKQGHVKVGDESISIYYELHGTGDKKALLVMGINSTCRNWDYQAQYFGSADEFTVLIYDNRGVGWSDASPWGYGTGEMAKDAVELLDHIGWTKDIHLVGHSMGGMIAQKLFLERSDIFASLTLAATSAGGFPFQWSGVSTLCGNVFIKDRNEIVRRLQKVNYTQNWLASKPDAVDSPHANNAELMAEVVIERSKLMRPQALQGALGHMLAVLRHYLTVEQLETIRSSGVSIMIIVGSEDKFISPSNSYYLKDVLDARRFEVFEDTGHGLQNQRPEKFCKLLEDFWKEVDGK